MMNMHGFHEDNDAENLRQRLVQGQIDICLGDLLDGDAFESSLIITFVLNTQCAS